MTAAEALKFVEQQGVVLVSAKGPVPRLTEAIAGQPVQGSWWAHPDGRRIFRVLEAVSDCDDVLTCRLVERKITLVHRRLWPAMVRLAARFPADRIARVQQEHTPSGKHANRETPFPEWVPAEAIRQAGTLSEEDALAALGPWALPDRSKK